MRVNRLLNGVPISKEELSKLNIVNDVLLKIMKSAKERATNK